MYARTNSRPVQHIDFLRLHKIRQRYWARNFMAWNKFSNFQPNATHIALTRFEKENRIIGLVTQNVDQLHHKAGSTNFIELHGNGYNVICVGKSDDGRSAGCNYRVERHTFQKLLEEINNKLNIDNVQSIRPDGDVDISQVHFKKYIYKQVPFQTKFVFFFPNNSGIY